VGDRYLDSLDVQLLRELDGIEQRFARFAGQADDEIAVDGKAQFVAVLREAAGHIDGCALLDVAENLLVARFITDDEKTAACFLHRFQRFVIGGDARGARPREV